MQAAHFHFCRRDAPLGLLKIKFSPFSLAKLSWTDEDQRRKPQGCFRQWQSVVILDGPEQRADTCWINNGGPVGDFWCSQRAPQVG